jgi:hypothetical protein
MKFLQGTHVRPGRILVPEKECMHLISTFFQTSKDSFTPTANSYTSSPCAFCLTVCTITHITPDEHNI